MTREEAIYILRNTAWIGSNDDRDNTEQAVEMAIKALEQEPCEDAVSRKAVLEDALRMCFDTESISDEVNGGNYINYEDAVGAVEDLPSVRPKPQTGKWINHRNDHGDHIADCDQCGQAIQWYDVDDEPKYCCMCGSRNER